MRFCVDCQEEITTDFYFACTMAYLKQCYSWYLSSDKPERKLELYEAITVAQESQQTRRQRNHGPSADGIQNQPDSGHMKSCVEPLNCLADKFLRIIRDIAKANVRVWQTKRADLTYQSVERLLRCDTLEAFKAQLKIESKAWALEGFRHRINHESKFKCNGEEIDEDDDCLETGEGHFKLISQPGEKETISDEWLEVNDRWIMEACKHATFKAAREIKHEATAENGSATADRLYALAGVVSITGIKQPADFVDIRQSGFKKAMLNLFGALPSSGGASKYKVGVKVKEDQLLVTALLRWISSL
jgi:hypothetical protein